MKKVFLVAFTLLCIWNVTLLAQRDPYLRPFANNSIWNMAIHKDAVYVDAKINAPTAWGVTSDAEILILSPTSPETGIYKCGWEGSKRCDKGAKISSGPIPDGWINGIPSGTPNNSTSILANDGHTIINLQCLHRCATTGPASSLYAYPSGDLYTDGIQGGHGGSGMSALGGSIRCGELTPNYTEAQIIADSNIYIQHVIKMNVNTKLYVSKTNGGYRWPAVKADGNYNNSGACDYYGGSVPQFKMGSLLAIPKNVNVEAMGLLTGPGLIMARTLQKYGAYLVDATCWDVVAIEVQTGPHGDVESQFASKYGYSFSPQSTSVAWAKDIAKIVQELFVVDNNNAANIGGGPTTDLVNRLAPAICDIGTPGSGIYNCGVAVNVPVTGVSINPATATVLTGATTQLSPVFSPLNATNQSVTWSSGNTDIATVGTTGVVTGVAVGTATITVTTADGSKTANCVITVKSSGGIYTYEAENGTYGGGGQTQTASNASNGYVIGNLNAVGSFTQVASVNGGSGGNASLVIRYSNGFSSTSNIGLYVNSTFIQNISFPVTLGWNIFSEVTVSISLSSGTGNTIKLQIGSGNAAADIDKYTVTPGDSVSVTGITVSPTSASVVVGVNTTLSATVAPANASNQSVTWTSSNTAIATVSTTGLVTGKAVGPATITVKTADGNKTATSAITVTAATVGSLKVHCIGNSLTQAEPGYRGVLKNKLAADGYNFSYVGRKTDGTSSHSGYGGYIVGPGASKVGNIYDIWTAGPNLKGVDCDIIILEIGINDYFNSTDATYNPESPATAKLDGLISLIYSTKPDVAIYVSNLTPVAWDANAFGPWNAQVPVIVKKYTDQGKKCYLADVRNGISWNLSTDISSDQLHPTAAGYTKMGNYYASLFESTNTVGVRETRESQNGSLMVYPNPVTDNMLNLSISGIANHEAINISLFDFSGKLIKNVKLQSDFDSENNVALNLENVNSGMYMLQVQSGTSIFRSKIIKI